MSARRIPVIPTILVFAAAATMVALGFWQLGRADEKAALIALYERALVSDAMRAFPADDGGAFKDEDLFHRTAFECTEVLNRQSIAGRNLEGRSGFAQVVRCQTGRGPADVKLGWSNRPDFPEYDGGLVTGRITPGGEDGARLQADPPLAEWLLPHARRLARDERTSVASNARRLLDRLDSGSTHT